MMLEKVDPREANSGLLGAARQPIRKLPFRLDEIPFYDTNYMCDPNTGRSSDLEDESDDDWDAPLRRNVNVSSHIINASCNSSSIFNSNKYER